MANKPEPGSAPQRVVSLVPSVTDSFITMGIGAILVGVTDFCPIPAEISGIRRVGGIKDARIHDILDLTPDLVIANREENSKEIVQSLEDAGVKVWVTFPRTVKQAIADLQVIASLFASEDLVQKVIWLERTADWLAGSRSSSPVRLFCPVWQDKNESSQPGWITFNKDTYAHDLLSLCGADNIFAEKGDARYPHVTIQEVKDASPECVLLPDEPFAFSGEDGQIIRDWLAGSAGNITVLRIDGRLIFWHGTRLGESIRVLPDLLRPKREIPAAS